MLIINDESLPKNLKNKKNLTRDIIYELITIKEMAKDIGLSRETLIDHIKYMGAPYYKMSGRLHVLKEEYLKWYCERMQG